MGHYDNCRPENCSICGQLRGHCVHTEKELLDNVNAKSWGSKLVIQIDGDHYKNFAIQPAEYSYKNKMNWHQGEIIKYITRYKLKNGRTDLEKARHLIDMLIEFEYDSS